MKNYFKERCYFIVQIIIKANIILNIYVDIFYNAVIKYGSVLW